MIRARVGIALCVLSALGVLPAGCHKAGRVQRSRDVAPVIKDTARVVAPLIDPSVIALFRDTAGASVFPAEGQIFKLQTPAQRQSLRARQLERSASCGRLESRATIDICSESDASVLELAAGY